MSGPRAKPLAVDTGPLYARFDTDDQHHEAAMTVFDGIVSGDFAYRPLYVSTHVLAEFATLVLHHGGPEAAGRALKRIRESDLFTVVRPSETEFDDACRALRRYDDQRITLVDHLTGALARGRDASHVFAFDSDFRTLGFTLVPAETGEDRP